MSRKLKTEELQRLSAEQYRKAQKPGLVLVLDNIRSLHNVGSAFRSADAFFAEKICLCGVTGTPPHREIEKTALGATESVAWEHFKSTRQAIDALRQDGYSIYAVEQTVSSTPLHTFAPGSEKTVLVFGNEIYGVEQEILELVDGIIEIPQSGTKHSLNVSVSIGIVLWEITRKKL